MASTRTKRQWWHHYRCTAGSLRPGGFFGRGPVYEQDIIHEAYSALEQGHIGAGFKVHNNGYIGSKRQCPAGIGGRKCQANGDNCSLHNYCIALDVEYQYNKLSPSYPKRVDPWSPFEFQFHTYEKDVFELGAGTTLEAAERAPDSGNPHVAGFEIPAEVTLDVQVVRDQRTGHNVVAYLPPTTDQSVEKPYVMLGAHYDHLGRGDESSLAQQPDPAGLPGFDRRMRLS